jgi:hypothetical protein
LSKVVLVGIDVFDIPLGRVREVGTPDLGLLSARTHKNNLRILGDRHSDGPEVPTRIATLLGKHLPMWTTRRPESEADMS